MVVHSSFGAPKNLPRGEGADGVGGRGNAEGNGDRGTNQDGGKSCVLCLFRQRKRCHLPQGGRSCQAYLKGSTITTAVGWMRKSCCLSEHRTPRALPTAMLKPRLRGAARRAHGSSAEHAMRDLIASHAPLRARRKSPWGKHVGTQHVRILQNITPGDSRGRQQGPRQSPTLVGLVGRGGAAERLSFCP